MFTAVVATLAVNIAANVVSPANDFANAFPRLITFKTGGLITGILGILIQPWRLLADPSGYIFKWLLGYSGGLGSIAGVLIADYWIVRDGARARGSLPEPGHGTAGGTRAASSRRSRAAPSRGAGCRRPLRPLYDYAWFVGFAVAAGVYLALARRPSPLFSSFSFFDLVLLIARTWVSVAPVL